MDLNEINPSDIPDISELKIDRRKKERILDVNKGRKSLCF